MRAIPARRPSLSQRKPPIFSLFEAAASCHISLGLAVLPDFIKAGFPERIGHQQGICVEDERRSRENLIQRLRAEAENRVGFGKDLCQQQRVNAWIVAVLLVIVRHKEELTPCAYWVPNPTDRESAAIPFNRNLMKFAAAGLPSAGGRS